MKRKRDRQRRRQRQTEVKEDKENHKVQQIRNTRGERETEIDRGEGREKRNTK